MIYKIDKYEECLYFTIWNIFVIDLNNEKEYKFTAHGGLHKFYDIENKNAGNYYISIFYFDPINIHKIEYQNSEFFIKTIESSNINDALQVIKDFGFNIYSRKLLYKNWNFSLFKELNK